jgi:hypothetical protein
MNLLPTEDDVLAVLVLKSALGQLMRASLGVSDEWGDLQDAWRETLRHDVSAGLLAVARERQEACGYIVSAAIAETERLWEVERAEQAVINAALEWRDTPTMLAADGLESAVDVLLHAETEVR